MNSPPSAVLVDSHCHLDFADFAADLDQVVDRARRGGIGTMVTIGTRLRDFPGVRAIAERFADVYCSVGVHPHEAAQEPQEDARELIRLADHPKVVGIGETGLDFHHQHGPREAQLANFRHHMRAARETGLPLIVHSRSADAETAAALAEGHREGAFTGLMHCFSSSMQLAEQALALGFYISLSGIVTFKNAEAVRAVARRVPLDRLLVETDAPYLAPVPKRGTRNEPAYLAHTAAAIAAVRDISVAELAAATTANFHSLFRKVAAPSACA